MSFFETLCILYKHTYTYFTYLHDSPDTTEWLKFAEHKCNIQMMLVYRLRLMLNLFSHLQEKPKAKRNYSNSHKICFYVDSCINLKSIRHKNQRDIYQKYICYVSRYLTNASVNNLNGYPKLQRILTNNSTN